MVQRESQVVDVREGTHEGIVELIAAVTGVKDEVGDVIRPGAFARTLAGRTPKGVLGHDWNRPISKVLDIAEWLPGDSRLPARTGDGEPWPRGAGALWVKALFNLDTTDGRNAFDTARFLGAEQAFSIGYKVAEGKAQYRGGVRFIEELDLFEFSPVLHGANRLARLLAVKHARPPLLEIKDAPRLQASPESVMADALTDEIVYQKDDDGSLRRVLFCAGCGVRFGSVFGKVSTTRKDDDEEALCVRCELAAALDGTAAV